MKIAMIGHKRVPSREGGIEVVVEELSKRFIKKGIKVELYNRKSNHVSGREFNKNSHLPGAKTINIPTPDNKSLNAIVYSFLSFIAAISGRYSLIHCHAEGPASMLFIPHIFGIPTVTTIHGLDWKRSKWGGFAKFYLQFGEKMAVKYSDEIIVLSKDMKDYFMEKYNRKTIYIPNGVNEPNNRKADIISKKYDLNKDEYILYLGRLVPEKEIGILIEAYQELKTDKKLVIAGGSSHSSEYVSKLKHLAKNNKNIIFTNFVQSNELDELYSNAYCYVLPSSVEGMPLSLLEAMSYGNACVVSDIPENKSVVKSYGLTFKNKDKKDLIKVLQDLLNNKDKKDELSASSREYVIKKYNWDEITNKTLQVYRKAIRKHINRGYCK